MRTDALISAQAHGSPRICRIHHILVLVDAVKAQPEAKIVYLVLELSWTYNTIQYNNSQSKNWNYYNILIKSILILIILVYLRMHVV